MKKIILTTSSKVNLQNEPLCIKSQNNSSLLQNKKRSKSYINFISGIEHIDLQSSNKYEELKEKITQEIGLLSLPSSPIGIISKCFLGAPHDVHILDLTGNIIIKHYKISESLPPAFEKARSLALHNQYSMIEVYLDKYIIVDEDGSTTKLTNQN